MAGPAPAPFDKAFGLAVARVRDACRLSQEGLAKAAELPAKVVRQIEAGTRPARLAEADALAYALDVPLTLLLGVGEPSTMPTDEVRARVDDLVRALDEASAQLEAFKAQRAEAEERREYFKKKVDFWEQRWHTLWGRWAEASAELDGRK